MLRRTLGVFLVALLFTGAASAQTGSVPTQRIDSLVTVESKTVGLSAETLERYTGVYAAVPRPNFKMTVTRQGDELYTQATGQRKIKVEPVSETRFAPTEVDAQIEFTVEDDGSVPKLTLYQGGRKIVFERTNE